MVDAVRDAHQLQGADAAARRDFLYLLAGATTAVGTGALVWPLIDSMNPPADVLALATVEADLTGVELGQRITVKCRGSRCSSCGGRPSRSSGGAPTIRRRI